MKRLLITAMTVCVVFSGMCASNIFAQDKLNGLVRLTGMARMRTVINEERAAHGLRALAFDSRLVRAAHNYAVVMVENTNQYPSHNIGKSMSERLQQDEGIRGEFAENIHGWSTTFGGGSVVDAVVRHNPNGWMNYNTPGRGQVHRAAILNPRFTHMGVGVTQSAQNNRYYFCLIVGMSQGTSGTAPQEFPSSSEGVLVRPVTVVNSTGRTLKYRFYIPATRIVRAHWSETFTLENGQRWTHGAMPGETLEATEVFGQRVADRVRVQLDKTHIARRIGSAFADSSGASGVSYNVSWQVR